MKHQSAAAILMVRPAHFGFDEQTAKTNAFQHESMLGDSEVSRRAVAEFDGVVQIFRQHDIDVLVHDDEPTPPKPNAVFVNNWFSTWPDGTLYLYPMATETRRPERSSQIVERLKKEFAVSSIRDLSGYESENRFLESTGAMVFDHINRAVYVLISSRCDQGLLEEHARKLGYRPVIFHAFDAEGKAIYHTNVVIGIQSTTAVVCSEAITDETERHEVVETLRSSGRIVVDITREQMETFCANLLEVRNRRGDRFLVLSQTAFDNLSPEQRHILGTDKTLIPVNIPTIESVGGGSARCMLGEIFLQPKS